MKKNVEIGDFEKLIEKACNDYCKEILNSEWDNKKSKKSSKIKTKK